MWGGNIALAQAPGALFLGRRAGSGGPRQGQPLRSGYLRVALIFVLALKLVKAFDRNLVSHFLHPGATQWASPVEILYLATAREPFVAGYLWQLALATVARIHVMCLNGAQVVGVGSGGAVWAKLALEQQPVLHVRTLRRPETVRLVVFASADLRVRDRRGFRYVEVCDTDCVGSPRCNRV